jgi:hypothetical protein
MTGELRITDMIGKIVLSQPFAGSGAKLSVAHLPSGTYSLQIITQNGPYTHQLFVTD